MIGASSLNSPSGPARANALPERILPLLQRTLIFALLSLALTAHAGVFKCSGADGRMQFSDKPCKSGAKTEVIPDRAPVTPQQQLEAQQRAARMQAESVAIDGLQPASETTPTHPPPSALPVQGDADAVANCIRDVERQPASQKIKAEMVVACQSAGRTQRNNGQSADAVSECVRSVERAGASGSDKARLLAQCHGGDVRTEPHYRPQR